MHHKNQYTDNREKSFTLLDNVSHAFINERTRTDTRSWHAAIMNILTRQNNQKHPFQTPISPSQYWYAPPTNHSTITQTVNHINLMTRLS